MKSIYISFILVFTCSKPFAQNLESKDRYGNPMLLGKSTRERLTQAPFDSWFNAAYNDYVVDSASAQELKQLLKGKRIQIFMGTWCGDSQREVPRMFKLLDHCGIPASQIELVNVDNSD